MADFSDTYLASKKLLEDYYQAMLVKNHALAFQIAVDLVETCLRLEDYAYDKDYTNIR